MKEKIEKSTEEEGASAELSDEELDEVSGGGVTIPKMVVMAIPGGGSGLGAGGLGGTPTGSGGSGGGTTPGGKGVDDALQKAADASAQLLNSVTKLF